jgi:inner membrane protein
MPAITDTVRRRLRGGFIHSEFGRLFWIALVVIVLQFPLARIDGVVQERIAKRAEASFQVGQSWGMRQRLVGPRLVVPVTETIQETNLIAGRQAVISTRAVTRYAVFLPEELKMNGKLASQIRHRGMFDVPVYTLRMDVSGTFARPDVDSLDIGSGTPRWDDAYLAFRVTGLNSMQRITPLAWHGDEREFEPAPSGKEATVNDLVVPLDLTDVSPEMPFSFGVTLRGSGALSVVPVGKTSSISLESDWADPSFTGGWLPAQYTSGPDGFTADWVASYVSRSLPQQWLAGNAADRDWGASLGVELLTVVDNYRLVERSVKYALLFLLLTFATVWLFDVLSASPVHPIQYLMIGSALAVFYLLLVSISEQLGFASAYLFSAVIVVGMSLMYTTAILRSRSRALVVAGLLAALYGYLYLVLHLQDLALLAGSLVVAASLAAIMYLTRNVDWFSLGRSD